MAELEAIAQRVRDTHTQMQTNSNQYFQEWDKELGQIQNKEIAAAGTQRREASIKAVEAVRQKLGRCQAGPCPFPV